MRVPTHGSSKQHVHTEHALRNYFMITEIKSTKSKGLGDTVKKVTEKLGIKQCGACKKRQAALNRLVPYKKGDKKEG